MFVSLLSVCQLPYSLNKKYGKICVFLPKVKRHLRCTYLEDGEEIIVKYQLLVKGRDRTKTIIQRFSLCFMMPVSQRTCLYNLGVSGTVLRSWPVMPFYTSHLFLFIHRCSRGLKGQDTARVGILHW